MVSVFKKFIAEESGATAIEYGLIAALVSVAGVVALQNVGGSLTQMFGVVDTKLQDAVAQSSGS